MSCFRCPSPCRCLQKRRGCARLQKQSWQVDCAVRPGHNTRTDIHNISARVCVCNICKDVKLQLLAGGSGPLMSPLPTKLLMSWEDIGTDHPDVPATCFVEWEEAQPKNLHAVFFWFSTSVFYVGLPVRFSQSDSRALPSESSFQNDLMDVIWNYILGHGFNI